MHEAKFSIKCVGSFLFINIRSMHKALVPLSINVYREWNNSTVKIAPKMG